MGRFCRQWLIKIRICCHDSDCLSDSGTDLHLSKTLVSLLGPTMCFLPLKIPLWFWLPFSSLLKLLPRRELFSHSLGISTLTQCLEGWQAAGNCYQLSEMMSSSWKQEKSGIEEKTIWPVSCSLSRLERSSVIRIQSGRSTSDSHTKSTFKETVFYSGVK